jgi:predicted nuclease with TOPRIM domain
MSEISDFSAFKRPMHVEDDASAVIARQKHEIDQLKKEMLEKEHDADAAAVGLEQMGDTIEEKEGEIHRLRLELFQLRLSLNNRNGEYLRLRGKMQGCASCSQRI